MSRYSADQHARFASDFERDGIVVLRNHFSRATLHEWQRAFAPLLQARGDAGTTAVRGQNRHYITRPFVGIFAGESIFCGPDIASIVEKVVGDDPVMCQLAPDTPLLGSSWQDIHRD